MLTPADVHHDRAREVLAKRESTLQQAWSEHPERFVKGVPKPQPLPDRGLDQSTSCGLDTADCSVNYDPGCPH